MTFCDLMISVNEVPTTAHLILVEVFKEENPIELGIQDRGGGTQTTNAFKGVTRFYASAGIEHAQELSVNGNQSNALSFVNSPWLLKYGYERCERLVIMRWRGFRTNNSEYMF